MMPAARKMDSLLALLGLVNYFPIQREDVGAEGRERRRVERKHGFENRWSWETLLVSASLLRVMNAR